MTLDDWAHAQAQAAYQIEIDRDQEIARQFGLIPPIPGHTAKTSHKGFLYGCFDCAVWNERAVRGCETCTRDGAPPHFASPGCQSGRNRYPHCACSSCFG